MIAVANGILHCLFGRLRNIDWRRRSALAAFTLLAFTSAHSAPIQYIYDEAGRLVGVINATGAASTYNYDSAGNLLSIISAGAVSIMEFTPNGGPVNTTVTINGVGFSATAAQNAVKFNGTAATITSATTTKIVTKVPTGATTGPISVTTPAGTATSSVAFVVGTSLTPTITSFTPTIGVAGTPVTITGTNYQSIKELNKVVFNTGFAAISSATPTTISTSVPGTAAAGKIAVSTPYGKATSSADFYVPPSGFSVAAVLRTGRLAVGGASLTANISTANKIGVYIFDGTAGDYMGIGVSAASCTPTSDFIQLKVFKPDGAQLSSFNVSPPAQSIDLPKLPVTGTYTVLVDPTNAATCTAALTTSKDLSATLVVDGASAALTTTRIGQNGRYLFSGNAGQFVSVGLSATTHTPATGCSSTVQVFDPSGVQRASGTLDQTSNLGLDLPQLTATGTYSVLVSPLAACTVATTMVVSAAQSVVQPVDGTAKSYSTTRVGQDLRLTFDATAGQSATLTIDSFATTPVGGTSTWLITKPDGTSVTSLSLGGGPTTNTFALPLSGTYTIRVDAGNRTMATGGRLWTFTDPVGGPIAIDGAPLVLPAVTKPGQRIVGITFNATAGQTISLGLSNLSYTPVSGCGSTLRVLKPDASLLYSNNAYVALSAGFDLPVIPTTGTYTVTIEPIAPCQLNSATLVASTPLTGTATINGGGVSATTTRVGQDLRITFTGSPGQITLSLGAIVTNPANRTWLLNLLKPDGGLLTNTQTSALSYSTPVTLPVSGTYTVVIDAGDATISSTLTLTQP